jgi:hypothetical protein
MSLISNPQICNGNTDVKRQYFVESNAYYLQIQRRKHIIIAGNLFQLSSQQQFYDNYNFSGCSAVLDVEKTVPVRVCAPFSLEHCLPDLVCPEHPVGRSTQASILHPCSRLIPFHQQSRRQDRWCHLNQDRPTYTL